MFKWISSWFQKILSRPYKNVVEELQSEIEKLSSKPKDVSEPVISIVESFKEKGRWKITDQTDPYSLGFSRSYYSFSVEDTKTGENYTLKSDSYHWLVRRWRLGDNIRFPRGMVPHYLPSWMTEAEKEYVCKNFEIISNKVAERIQLVEDRYRTKDEKQAKENQDKERQRLISIYCKEEV